MEAAVGVAKGQDQAAVALRLFDGAGALERALPLLPKLSPAARGYAAQVLQQYAKQLQGGPQAALGQRFAAVAAGLQ